MDTMRWNGKDRQSPLFMPKTEILNYACRIFFDWNYNNFCLELFIFKKPERHSRATGVPSEKGSLSGKESNTRKNNKMEGV